MSSVWLFTGARPSGVKRGVDFEGPEGAMPRGEPDGRGTALPVVLLLMVALTLMAHGAVELAVVQVRAAAGSAREVEGRLVADGAVRRYLAASAMDSLPAPPLWRRTEVAAGRAGGAVWSVGLERLERELYLVGGTARSHPGAPAFRAARLVWSLDPLARTATAEAVLVHGGGLVSDGTSMVDGVGYLRSAPGDDRCDPWEAALDSLAPRILADVDRGPTPAGGDRRVPALGLLEERDLLERVHSRVSGIVTPSPRVVTESCEPGVLNWGSPTDPDGPCGSRRTAVVSEGDLTLDGGEGQGLLVVRGSLALKRGAVFEGLALVRDTVILAEGARLRGLVRTGGPARLTSGSRIEGRACPVVLGLASAPALRAPIPVPGGGHLIPF